MKKLGKIIVFIFVITTSCLILNAKPGTNEDPLVSKTYVDERFKEFLTMLDNAQGSNLNKDTKDNIVQEVMKELDGILSNAMPQFKALQLKQSQKLNALEGCELILRSGEASVFSYVANGLADVSAAKEVFHGQAAEKNHLYLSGRSDGRGIHATTDCWLLVKGNYIVE